MSVADNATTQGAWIYISEAIGSGLYKVGMSACPFRRRIGTEIIPPEARGLDLALSHLILCKDAASMERRLHEHFESKWHAGEWFALDGDDLAQIKGWATCEDVLASIGPSVRERLVHFVPAALKARALKVAKRLGLDLGRLVEEALRRLCRDVGEEVAGDVEALLRKD